MRIKLSTSPSHSIQLNKHFRECARAELAPPPWLSTVYPCCCSACKAVFVFFVSLCVPRARLLKARLLLCVACLTSKQHASVSRGRICFDKFKCCHTEIEVADPTFYLTQKQYTDTGPTAPSVAPITPGAWQGSHWNANF